MESIGCKIRSLRKNKGLTQEELAEVLLVSAQTISKWENQLSAPDITLLPVIARFFGVTMDELFGYRLEALNHKERFIRFMADNGVLRFGRFTLRSGRISPYFINSGHYAAGSQIARLGEFYAGCFREHGLSSRRLASSSERETPLVIATAMTLYAQYGADLTYRLRPEEESASGTVLLQDTLTSGDTLREKLTHIRAEHVIVAVDRMERGSHPCLSASHQLETECGVRIHAIVTAADIIRAVESGVVAGAEHLEALRAYQKRYGGC